MNKKILVIDYAFCKEFEMIGLATKAKDILIRSAAPQLLLSCFHNCYVTPAFMRHVEGIVSENIQFIEKQALIGLSTPKKIILKAFNLFLNRDYQAFDSLKEAIEYLIEEEVSDAEIEAFQNQKDT